MLSGIKVGKKKKSKKPSLKEPPKYSSNQVDTIANSDDNDNLSVAEKLRRSLASGDATILEERSASRPIDRLERRPLVADNKDESGASVVVLNTITSNKPEEDMTAAELAMNERKSSMSWDEQMIRNAVRIGKKRRRKGSNDDSDEELEKMKRLLPGHAENKKEKAAEKSMQRESHRQVDHHLQQKNITSKCAWWVDSNSFSKHRLLALGNHVSLVMAPPNGSLIPGHHFYLVPIKHSSSFVECEDDSVWDEVRRFQTALSNMYATQRKGIIMCETVLPNKNFWQTKMDVIAVPFSVLQDAPMFFKSSMMEQSEEWGTHNKVMQVSRMKPLKSVIPNQGFPYFFVEWGNVSTSSNTGYAQIIEASNFRHDFGLDTLSSIMDLDPIRFHRKKKFSHEEERQNIVTFLESWKKFDWTTQLD
jgi:hypothetical protein